MSTASEAPVLPHDRTIEVLNFEDDPTDALIVERALRKVFLMSCRVTTVARLEDGLQRLREKAFDVALVDLHLPDASGMKTFERLRTEAPNLPLIVLTGNDDDRLAVQILREGAQDYLLKNEGIGPVLAKAIRYAIERHRIRVELNARARELEEREATLRRARNRYFALFDRGPIGYLVFDPSHSIKEINSSAAQLFGANQDNNWDTCFYGCLPERSRRIFADHLDQTFATPSKHIAMIHAQGKDGAERELHFESQLLQTESEGGAQCLSAFVDLTEQKKAESRLAKALREKDVLLKEIHHRVKNNLQIISSLLNLQSRGIKDTATLEVFRESCDRVQLMALIHEKLYSAMDLSQLDFNDYLHSLTAMILRSYANKARNVHVVFELHDQLHLSLDQAIPLGLIASELFSNSLKHAFPRGGKGKISLELTQAGSDCTFSISDDGQGLPENFTFEQPTSLGLRLVNLLSQQLEAELTWQREPCTRFTLTFQTRGKTKKPKHEPVFAQST